LKKSIEIADNFGENMEMTKEHAVLYAGIGSIEPDAQRNLADIEATIVKFEKPIEDTAVVCIDGRPSEQSHEPVREKVAGGNLNTFLYAAAAINWRGFSDEARTAGPSKMLEEAADFLVSSDEKLGAHVHTQNHGSGTGCGAIDKAHEISKSCAEHADEWEDYAKAILGDSFDSEAWNSAKEGYGELAKNAAWEQWHTNAIQKQVRKKFGVVEELENNTTDPNHGHHEQAIHINFKEGYSNDRDQTNMQYFEVDVAPILRMARKATTEEREFNNLLHAMLMRQLGTAYQLTRNQNIVITRQ